MINLIRKMLASPNGMRALIAGLAVGWGLTTLQQIAQEAAEQADAAQQRADLLNAELAATMAAYPAGRHLDDDSDPEVEVEAAS